MDIKGTEETMAAACEFDKLFTKAVPHILEQIFFSVDYESFKKCLKVSKSWNDLLTSESFLRRGKSVFCEDIQEELLLAADLGNVDAIRRVLSHFMVDINFMTERNGSPLMLAAEKGHQDVVQLLLDRGAEPNIANQFGRTAQYYALQNGHLDIANILTKLYR